MNQMINEEIIKAMAIHESCYEDNCNDEGQPYWEAEDFADIEEAIEIIGSFWITTPYHKGRRTFIMKIEDNTILFWEMISILNTMDLNELASAVEEERDSCAVWAETHSYNFGGY